MKYSSLVGAVIWCMVMALESPVAAQDSGTLQQSVEKSLRDCLSENVRLNSQTSQLQQRATDLENYLRGLSVTNNNLRQENERLIKLAAEAADLRPVVESLKNKIAFFEKEAEAMQKKIKSAAALLAQVTLENRELKVRLEGNAIEQENRQFRSQLASLKEQAEKAVREISRLSSDREAFVRETSTLHYNLGVMLFQDKEYQKAADEFKRSVELDPLNAAAYYNLGVLYDEYLASDADAIAYYRHYLEVVPRQATPLGKSEKSRILDRILQAQLRHKSKVVSPVDATIR